MLNYLPKECYATENITFSDNNKTLGNLLAGRDTPGVAIRSDNQGEGATSERTANGAALKIEIKDEPLSSFRNAKKKIDQAKNLPTDLENAV